MNAISLVNTTSHESLEKKVTIFLQQYAKDAYSRDKIAPMVASTSLLPNHLYEDLGFKNRFIMGKFMHTHFPILSTIKPKEILWKKYIYDSVGEVAPACENCKDSVNCFACKV